MKKRMILPLIAMAGLLGLTGLGINQAPALKAEATTQGNEPVVENMTFLIKFPRKADELKEETSICFSDDKTTFGEKIPALHIGDGYYEATVAKSLVKPYMRTCFLGDNGKLLEHNVSQFEYQDFNYIKYGGGGLPSIVPTASSKILSKTLDTRDNYINLYVDSSAIRAKDPDLVPIIRFQYNTSVGGAEQLTYTVKSDGSVKTLDCFRLEKQWAIKGKGSGYWCEINIGFFEPVYKNYPYHLSSYDHYNSKFDLSYDKNYNAIVKLNEDGSVAYDGRLPASDVTLSSELASFVMDGFNVCGADNNNGVYAINELEKTFDLANQIDVLKGAKVSDRNARGSEANPTGCVEVSCYDKYLEAKARAVNPATSPLLMDNKNFTGYIIAGAVGILGIAGIALLIGKKRKKLAK